MLLSRALSTLRGTPFSMNPSIVSALRVHLHSIPPAFPSKSKRAVALTWLEAAAHRQNTLTLFYCCLWSPLPVEFSIDIHSNIVSSASTGYSKEICVAANKILASRDYSELASVLSIISREVEKSAHLLWNMSQTVAECELRPMIRQIARVIDVASRCSARNLRAIDAYESVLSGLSFMINLLTCSTFHQRKALICKPVPHWCMENQKEYKVNFPSNSTLETLSALSEELQSTHPYQSRDESYLIPQKETMGNESNDSSAIRQRKKHMDISTVHLGEPSQQPPHIMTPREGPFAEKSEEHQKDVNIQSPRSLPSKSTPLAPIRVSGLPPHSPSIHSPHMDHSIINWELLTAAITGIQHTLLLDLQNMITKKLSSCASISASGDSVDPHTMKSEMDRRNESNLARIESSQSFLTLDELESLVATVSRSLHVESISLLYWLICLSPSQLVKAPSPMVDGATESYYVVRGEARPSSCEFNSPCWRDDYTTKDTLLIGKPPSCEGGISSNESNLQHTASKGNPRSVELVQTSPQTARSGMLKSDQRPHESIPHSPPFSPLWDANAAKMYGLYASDGKIKTSAGSTPPAQNRAATAASTTWRSNQTLGTEIFAAVPTNIQLLSPPWYHGTSLENVYSCLQYGLRPLSGSRHEATGAVFGEGVYLCRDPTVSMNFMKKAGVGWPGYLQKESLKLKCLTKGKNLSSTTTSSPSSQRQVESKRQEGNPQVNENRGIDQENKLSDMNSSAMSSRNFVVQVILNIFGLLFKLFTGLLSAKSGQLDRNDVTIPFPAQDCKVLLEAQVIAAPSNKLAYQGKAWKPLEEQSPRVSSPLALSSQFPHKEFPGDQSALPITPTLVGSARSTSSPFSIKIPNNQVLDEESLLFPLSPAPPHGAYIAVSDASHLWITAVHVFRE